MHPKGNGLKKRDLEGRSTAKSTRMMNKRMKKLVKEQNCRWKNWKSRTENSVKKGHWVSHAFKAVEKRQRFECEILLFCKYRWYCEVWKRLLHLRCETVCVALVLLPQTSSSLISVRLCFLSRTTFERQFNCKTRMHSADGSKQSRREANRGWIMRRRVLQRKNK